MSKIKIDLSHKIIIAFVMLVCLILAAFVIILNTKKSFGINSYNENGIKFNYDNTFKLHKKKDYIELVSSDNKTVVSVKKIEYSYDLDIDSAESIAYQVVSSDGTYTKVYSNFENDKYYFLYENYDKERQIEVIEIKKEDYLYILVFEASSNEFDLYQESFDIIVNSFKV